MNSNTNKNNLQLSVEACVDTLPLAIAVIPWGILTGALGIQVGLTPLQAQLMSLLVFAGAAQLSALTLMAGPTSMLSIFGSTFVISARHLLYSVTFREHVMHLSLAYRGALAFVLTDEMFAVSEAHTKRTGAFSAIFALASGVTFYVIWNLATLVGIVAGESFENIEQLGLDFAIVATFIAMTFDQLKQRPVAVAMIVSGVLAVLLKPLFSESYIILASLAGMACAYAAANAATPTTQEVE
ncbi:MAG: AzlC family ABC transporter permease [Pseudomonadota bacterium]